MSEADLGQNIVDLTAYRAARAAVATARRASHARNSSYLLWYPGAGVAMVMRSSPGHARSPTPHSQESVLVPEGA